MGIALKGLYALSDEVLTPYDELPDMLTRAIEGGVSLFQLRDKSHSAHELLGLAKDLSKICQKRGVGFVINDHLDVALGCHAWGLHLGSSDVPLKQAQRFFKGQIGISCYGSVERALQAQKEGAGYVAFGSCFPSPTKPHAPCISLDILQRAKACLKIPVCAIGGIHTKNATLLRHADMIALVSGLWKGDVWQNAQELLGWKG